jgi:two-component system CheB/CheR fusion protein
MAPHDPRLEQSALSRRLAACQAHEDVLAAVREGVREDLDADGVALVLREGDLCHYAAENAISPLWEGKRFAIDTCISGWSMLHAETVVIEDIRQDTRIPQDAYKPTFVKSLIMTPVGADTPAAAFGAYWRSVRRFTDPEITTVRMMGFLIGEALRRLPT